MKRFFYLFIAAAMLMTSCAKENGADSPAPEQETVFTVQQTQLTQGSFSARIIPQDNENPYYFGVVSKKEFDELYNGNGEDLQSAYLDWFDYMAKQQGLTIENFLSNALLSGMQDYQFRSLTPDTEYVFFVFGVDYTGKATSEVETEAFKTPKAALNTNAKFSITPVTVGSTFFIVDIECSDPDIFYYYDVMMPSVYEQYCGSNPANITSYMESYLSALKSENDNYADMSMPQFISSITVSGKYTYDTAGSEAANSLIPEMEFPVFAIGIANDGSFTTEPTVVMVKTAESPTNSWTIQEGTEVITDTKYNITINAAFDEVFAAIVERSVYFDGLNDEQIVNELLAARRNDFTNDLYVTRAKIAETGLIPDEDYTLVLIACTPDGQPKTGDKLNVVKRTFKTSTAVKTGAVYSLKVYDITKTGAKVSIAGDKAAEGQTYMLNYAPKAEIDALAKSEGSLDAAYRKACDNMLDAQLKAWNSSHPSSVMDRREFLSRSLLSDLTSGTYYTLDGLTPGTEYVMYAIGLKADGTYTTEAFTSAFKTVADKNSQISLSVGMSAWMFDDIYPNQTNYTVSAMAVPYNLADAVYCRSFIGTDEWAGKSGAELETLLKQETYKVSDARLTVERGTTFYVYFIGFDTDGVSTDITKITHTSKAEGGNTGMGQTISISDKEKETISVR